MVGQAEVAGYMTSSWSDIEWSYKPEFFRN